MGKDVHERRKKTTCRWAFARDMSRKDERKRLLKDWISRWASVQTRIGPNIGHGKWATHGWNWALGQDPTKKLNYNKQLKIMTQKFYHD